MDYIPGHFRFLGAAIRILKWVLFRCGHVPKISLRLFTDKTLSNCIKTNSRGRDHFSMKMGRMVLFCPHKSILSCNLHQRPLVSIIVHRGLLLIFCGGA